MIKNLKVKTKLRILMALIIIISSLIASISVFNQISNNKRALAELDTSIRIGYDDNIKNEVLSVVSLLDAINDKYKKGDYTLEEAKTLAADLVRDMQYSNGGYFWIDTVKGQNVVLLGSSTEGTNRYNATDANDFRMIEAIISAGQQEGGGYVDYYFPKKGETEASPKRSYSLEFEPFGWVVGTGNYTDYIDGIVSEYSAKQNEELKQSVIIMVSIIVIIIVVSVALTSLISNQIIKSLNIFKKHIKVISDGDFSNEMPSDLLKRKDDFGELAQEMTYMQDSVRALIRRVKDESNKINSIVASVNNNVYQLNTNIESVSSTTEELAAGMEETAASSEEIAASSHELQSAAKNIAEKSQDGAIQAIDISKRAEKTKLDTEKAKLKSNEMHNQISKKLNEALNNAEIVNEINVLSDAIMEITAQTNLLALNASIEASRAGEAGKGFAVVADEIRNLAEQSKNAVSQIQEVTIQVTDAVNNLSESSSELLQYVATDVADDYKKFLDVAELYNNDANYVDELVGDFSATSEQLLASIEDVLHAINEVARASSEGATGTTDIAQKTSDVMEKSSDILTEVSNTQHSAECLQNEIGKFKV